MNEYAPNKEKTVLKNDVFILNSTQTIFTANYLPVDGDYH